MKIMGIDPGSSQSGWAIFDSDKQTVLRSGVIANTAMARMLDDCAFHVDQYAIEDITNYGKIVGEHIFETCKWIGRFSVYCYGDNGQEPLLIERKKVKLHHCLTSTADDAAVRAALLTRLGHQGTKKKPGPTYGVASHAWQALALAVYVGDTAAARAKGAVA